MFVPDFDEQVIMQLPAENFDNGDTFDVYMQLVDDRNKRDSLTVLTREKNVATLRFVFGGSEFSLVGIPYDSLLKVADFIKKYVEEHQE